MEKALKVELVLTGYALFDKLKLDRFRFVWFRLQAGQFVLFEAFTVGFRLELCRSGLRFDRLGLGIAFLGWLKALQVERLQAGFCLRLDVCLEFTGLEALNVLVLEINAGSWPL